MTKHPKFKIAVLISGGGTTLRNLIEKRDAGLLDVDIALVISSKPDAGGLQFARQAAIDFEVFDHQEFNKPEAISERIFAACRDAQIDLVVMGGFLRKVVIPDDFANRVVNIHPSLIPAFCGKGMYGMRVHRAVVEKGSPVSGCTVHFVDNQFDHGPIIAQESVSVGDSTAEQLQQLVFLAECDLYPKVIGFIARGEVKVVGDEVVVGGGSG